MTCWLVKNITDFYVVWIIATRHQGLCQKIVTYLLSKAQTEAMWWPQVVTGANLSIEGSAIVCFSLPQLTHKDSILYHKAVKVTIDAPNFAKVFVDLIVCLQVVTNSGTFYPQNLSLLCYFLCIRRSPFYRKLTALPKGQIATSRVYLWVFVSSKLLSALSVCQLQTRWVAWIF